jgi:hypothetical protein
MAAVRKRWFVRHSMLFGSIILGVDELSGMELGRGADRSLGCHSPRNPSPAVAPAIAPSKRHVLPCLILERLLVKIARRSTAWERGCGSSRCGSDE